MKLFAHYDAAGNILSLTCFNAPKGISLMLAPQAGEQVTEIHDHPLTTGTPTEQALRELAKSHTIAQPLPRSTLTKKA